MLTTFDVTIRILNGERDEMAELQRVLESAPDFNRRTTGGPAGPADAQSIYSTLPDGKSYDDKFVFGIYANSEMVGCIDLIRDYPSENVAWIGLLLLSEKFQHKGLGKRALYFLELYVREWKKCERIQLAVVSTNEIALPYWRKMGFSETGKRTRYSYNRVEAESIFMEKLLVGPL